jgi:hypothetical protein
MWSIASKLDKHNHEVDKDFHIYDGIWLDHTYEKQA